jgi:hypothetical protein
MESFTLVILSTPLAFPGDVFSNAVPPNKATRINVSALLSLKAFGKNAWTGLARRADSFARPYHRDGQACFAALDSGHAQIQKFASDRAGRAFDLVILRFAGRDRKCQEVLKTGRALALPEYN